MKTLFYFSPLFLILLISGCSSEKIEQNFVSSDIDNFWKAFDRIQTNQDSVEQIQFLQTLFLDKASHGQKAMIEARNYSDEEYLTAIRNYPAFWQSLRANTNNTEKYNNKILGGLENLKALYPSLRPSTIYYTMGVFRSPGTGFDSLVLNGTEFLLGDKQTDVSEFPASMDYMRDYYSINPTDYIDFLTVHEYVHTQQKPIVNNLLSQTLFEGIAEFIAELATNKKSPWAAFTYGNQNEKMVRDRFEAEMFNGFKGGNWLWNSKDNPFGTRDMGYYVGDQIARRYYEQAEDKQLAIQTLIDLDYTDEPAVEDVVHASGYLSASLDVLYENYENQRPKVVAVQPFENGSTDVNPDVTEITIVFSEPLDTRYRSTGFGELGQEHFPKLDGIDFAEDGKSVTYKVKLEPKKRYQILLENGYRTSEHNPLKPYLIDFTTK